MRPVTNIRRQIRRLAFGLALLPSAALAAQCGTDPGTFGAWLKSFKAEAVAAGVSERAADRALAGLTYDPHVIHLDHSQKSFKFSFEKFYAIRVDDALINHGRRLMRQYHDVLARIEERYGVPGSVIVSIWGLETGYGTENGDNNFSILRSVATLAFDCRRTEFFQGQLMDALRIVDRGDLTPEQLRGGWAGEIGQTQFLPSPYVKYAVDFENKGRRDLIHNVPDILASTANFLKEHGWQKGASWQVGGPNYAVLAEWNKADVYDRTIAVMAAKMGGG